MNRQFKRGRQRQAQPAGTKSRQPYYIATKWVKKSKWAKEIEAIMCLMPGESMEIPIPGDQGRDRYRHTILCMIRHNVVPYSPFRYRTAFTAQRGIRVSCLR